MTPIHHLTPGSPADITLVDPHREWVVNTSELASKGKNTLFQRATFRGKVVATIVGGEVRYREVGCKASVNGGNQTLGGG
jgi:dihydroorotase